MLEVLRQWTEGRVRARGSEHFARDAVARASARDSDPVEQGVDTLFW